jgi:predicted DNA-binding transcriptional regulator YafY
MGREVKDVFDTLHAALGRHAVARLSYRDAQGQLTERCIQPLGLFFWGQVWLVAAWCEHRQDYRTFRLDRCVKVDILERHFAESAERSLADFMRKVRGSTD